MSEEIKAVCPECGSPLISEISNFKKCLQCGHQFDLVKDPVGQRARSAPKVGWPPNPAYNLTR
jgi:DNA-directed RNA polymerase subunit RPC12/RpoP